MQIREIMTPNPTCCTPDTTLQEVARLMQENDCGCIPVVDSQSGMKPVGTITDRDITIRTVAANRNPINMKASEIMTTNIATVKPQMSIEQCFDVMEDREIRRVLVVDEQGKCCGIVAQADVVQSNINPVRTNEVIREISESSPSYNQRISADRRNNQSRSSIPSYLNSGSLLPLLIGIGSGVGLMYLLNTQQRKTNYRDYTNSLNTNTAYESDFLNATNEENFGRYVDAEQEIETRQHNIADRVQAFRTESDSPLTNKVESINREDETFVNKDKGRSASQS
jgi:CBS domain-containing protein